MNALTVLVAVHVALLHRERVGYMSVSGLVGCHCFIPPSFPYIAMHMHV